MQVPNEQIKSFHLSQNEPHLNLINPVWPSDKLNINWDDRDHMIYKLV